MSRREIERASGVLEEIVKGYLREHPAYPKGTKAVINIILPGEMLDEATRNEFRLAQFGRSPVQQLVEAYKRNGFNPFPDSQTICPRCEANRRRATRATRDKYGRFAKLNGPVPPRIGKPPLLKSGEPQPREKNGWWTRNRKDFFPY